MVCSISKSASAEYYLGEIASYYTDGKEAGGEWFSREGIFGIKDKSLLTQAEFQNLFSGSNFRGERLIKKSGLKGRVNAYDLTFSAPKSFSIYWSQQSDNSRSRIEAIQDMAVRKALAILNNHATFARRGKGGVKVERVSLTAGLFMHGEARPVGNEIEDRRADPQIHTHAVAINLSERTDGTIGALDGSFLYDWKMAAGAIYRAELAALVQSELGLQIDVTDKEKGFFEISGIPREVIDHFSKRGAEVKEELKKAGVVASENQALAARKAKSTRSNKHTVYESRRDQFKRWRREASEIGFSYENIKSYKHDSNTKIEICLSTLLDRLHEHESTFLLRDIYQEAAKLGMESGFSVDEISQAVNGFVAKEDILNLHVDKKQQVIYSSKQQIEIEKELVAFAQSMNVSETYALGSEAVQNYLSESDLTKEQMRAVHAATLNSDLSIVEGAAGAGKSYALKSVVQLYESYGYRVIGSATAWKIAKQLSMDCGIESKATDKWLFDHEADGRFLDKNTVLVVDEAGQLSARQMHKILAAAEQAGAKVILTGDQKQLQPISAGAGLKLVSSVIEGSRIDVIQRQKERWVRKAVTDLVEGNTGRAIKAFEGKGKLNLCYDQQQAVNDLVDRWWRDERLTPNTSKLVMARTHNQLHLLNQAIREKMIASGRVQTNSIEIINDKKQFLNIAQGDKVVFTKKIAKLGIVNGTDAIIEHITDSSLKIRINDQVIKLSHKNIADKNGALPLRYGYASTIYSSQGMTVDNAYILAAPNLSREEIYVAASRSKTAPNIYVPEDQIKDSLYERGHEASISENDIKSYLGEKWSLRKEKVNALDFIRVDEALTMRVDQKRENENSMVYE